MYKSPRSISPSSVVGSTVAGEIPGELYSGGPGGPLTLPSGTSLRAAQVSVEVRSDGGIGGTWSCELQVAVDGGSFFTQGSAFETGSTIHFTAPITVQEVLATWRSFEFRVLCSSASSRSVTSARMSAVAVASPPS